MELAGENNQSSEHANLHTKCPTVAITLTLGPQTRTLQRQHVASCMPTKLTSLRWVRGPIFNGNHDSGLRWPLEAPCRQSGTFYMVEKL